MVRPAEPLAAEGSPPELAEAGAPAATVPDTPARRPEIESSAPAEGWTPYVGGNASSYGEPDRDDLQWVAWQPACPSCEPGVTMSWVGSYAFPFNRPVGVVGQLRPKLTSNCFHRVRSAPRIEWYRDVGGDSVVGLRVDGESVPPGAWWLADVDGAGDDSHLMIPEPVPFIDLIRDAQQLRVLTAEGIDATFDVTGFLTTPVQANLDHCGHYP